MTMRSCKMTMQLRSTADTLCTLLLKAETDLEQVFHTLEADFAASSGTTQASKASSLAATAASLTNECVQVNLLGIMTRLNKLKRCAAKHCLLG